MTDPNPEEKKLSLRFWMDPKTKKVAFAEADSDFVDILLSFMALPLGTIVRLQDKHFGSQREALGSLNTLYDSLKKLNTTCFWTEEVKLMLLNPRNPLEALCQKLKLNIDPSDPIKYFICDDLECIKKNYKYLGVSMYNVSKCCSCGGLVKREVGYDPSNVQVSPTKGVFTTPSMCFLITDDLHVMTHLAGSSIELLSRLGITRMSALVENTCILGLKEIVQLIKRSIVSKTPLSDVILDNRSVEFDTLFPLYSQASTTRNMTLKIIVHKLTKKVIFAQAQEDFVDFLFSLLTIPLGNVVSLLSGNTSLGSILNLYNSISTLYHEKYLKSNDVKNMLLNPNLPPNYICKNQIFAIKSNSPPSLICKGSMVEGNFNVNIFHFPIGGFTPSTVSSNFCNSVYLVDLRGGQQGFVREPAMFMVTDDMSVTPLTPLSCISFLDKLGISFCDIEEQVLNIGTIEALAILRSSLSSSSALTNALTSKKLMKQ